jgi:hypothetical protein
MEQFDARAVMAARIAEECNPDSGAGHESQPMVDQRDEPPPAHPYRGDGRASGSTVAAARPGSS